MNRQLTLKKTVPCDKRLDLVWRYSPDCGIHRQVFLDRDRLPNGIKLWTVSKLLIEKRQFPYNSLKVFQGGGELVSVVVVELREWDYWYSCLKSSIFNNSSFLFLCFIPFELPQTHLTGWRECLLCQYELFRL